MADVSAPRNPDDGPPPPRKLTEAVIQGVRRIILEGNFRSVAAKRMRVGLRTFDRWMALGRRYPEGIYGRLRQAVLEAEAAAERLAVRGVLLAGHTEDARHLEWWLERKHPERWGRYRGELADLKKDVAELRKLIGEAADPKTA
jgi:hypothetical protein